MTLDLSLGLAKVDEKALNFSHSTAEGITEGMTHNWRETLCAHS
jgi:hypothetical protein